MSQSLHDVEAVPSGRKASQGDPRQVTLQMAKLDTRLGLIAEVPTMLFLARQTPCKPLGFCGTTGRYQTLHFVSLNPCFWVMVSSLKGQLNWHQWHLERANCIVV